MTALLNPSLLLVVLLAVGLASLFHLWTGRTLGDLAVYLAGALVGAALGQWIGRSAGLDVLQIGQFHLLEAALGSILALMIIKTFQT